MRLDILIPHYNEPMEVITPLLMSIALQQGIDLDDIKVILVNDGDSYPISEISGYPFTIECYTKEHEGVSAARNYALDRSDADYVMFCDDDDMFISLMGLHLLFGAMNEGYDVIISTFVEEHMNPYKIVRREHDTTFVHGKAFKRSYLVEKNLRFRPDLTIHEDGYFNCLAFLCTENKKEINTPFYLWKWREGSVAQKGDNLFVLKTYDHVMKTRDAICEESFKRGYVSQSNDFVVKTVMDSYYDFQHPFALNPKNKDIVRKAKKAFADYYKKWGKVYRESDPNRVGEVMYMSRNLAVAKGMRIEQQTVREFLNEITHL